MSDDPFEVLEQAVSAVEEALASVGRDRRALASRLEQQSARAETLQDARRDDRDAEARIEALEKERAAVRERLRHLRERLAVIADTPPELPLS